MTEYERTIYISLAKLTLCTYASTLSAAREYFFSLISCCSVVRYQVGASLQLLQTVAVQQPTESGILHVL